MMVDKKQVGYFVLGIIFGMMVAVLYVKLSPGIIAAIVTAPHPVITASDNLDKLKADCYVSGFIDGRGSVFQEQSTTGYISKDLGMPEGYTSDRTSQWRDYADLLVSTRSRHPTTNWFPIDQNLVDTHITTPTPVPTIPEDAVITGISWYTIREGVSP
jgi:hypothetical protein